MDGFISKPFRLEDLRRQVCETCLRCQVGTGAGPVPEG